MVVINLLNGAAPLMGRGISVNLDSVRLLLEHFGFAGNNNWKHREGSAFHTTPLPIGYGVNHRKANHLIRDLSDNVNYRPTKDGSAST